MSDQGIGGDLKLLWRSAPGLREPSLAARAIALRRRAVGRTLAESAATALLLAALMLKAGEGAGERIVVAMLAAGAAGSQLRLAWLRRRLWRDIGRSPRGYWAAVAGKARVGIRLARGTCLAGPPCVVAGALLARAVQGSGGAITGGTVALLAGASAALFLLGWWQWTRERRELEQALEVLQALDADEPSSPALAP
jgi:hypothetical protein